MKRKNKEDLSQLHIDCSAVCCKCQTLKLGKALGTSVKKNRQERLRKVGRDKSRKGTGEG